MRQTKLFLIVAILVTYFSSCKDSSSELTNVIPSSAITVVHFDTKSVLSKSNFKPLDNPMLKEALEKEKNRGSENNTKMIGKLEDFLKNPNSSGVDLIDDCFLYVDNLTVGIVWEMNDAKKFKDLLVKDLDLPEQMLTEEDGVTVIDMSRDVKVGWTKDKLLVMTYGGGSYMYGYSDRPDLTALLKKQLKQTASESINSNKAFAQFLSNKKDISVFYAYDNVAGMWSGMMSKMMGMSSDPKMDDAGNILNKLSEQVKGVSAGAFMSFEKGEITFDQKYYFDSSETEKRFTELSQSLVGDIKGDQLKYFAEKPLFLVSANLKGDGIYKYLADLGIMSLIEKEANQALSEVGMDLNSLISNVNGDITFALNGVKQVKKTGYSGYEYNSTEPEFSFFMEMKDAKAPWEAIIAKAKEEKEMSSDSSIVEINPNTYSIDMGDGMRGFIGIKDNTFFFTNNESVYTNMTSNNLKNDIASLGSGKQVFVYGNLNSLRPLISEELGEPKLSGIVLKGFDLLGDYSFTVDKGFVSQGKFVINNTSENSLAVIFGFINDVVTYAVEQKM